jgi:DNA repair ATPase RecN
MALGPLYWDQKERIDEIASMLSGKELSEAALSNARSLLGLSS